MYIDSILPHIVSVCYSHLSGAAFVDASLVVETHIQYVHSNAPRILLRPHCAVYSIFYIVPYDYVLFTHIYCNSLAFHTLTRDPYIFRAISIYSETGIL